MQPFWPRLSGMTPAHLDAPSTTTEAFESLLACLDLQAAGTSHIHYGGTTTETAFADTDRDVFVGSSMPTPHGRAFGGQVLAQSIIAAGRTVHDVPGQEERRIHSLHGYFLRPADSRAPLRFLVERMRDGGSFSARRVHAVQDDQIVLSMITSFQEPAEGLHHQDEIPAVPLPEILPSAAQLLAEAETPVPMLLQQAQPVDLRHCEDDIYFDAGEQRIARQNVWFRTHGAMPDDPLLNAAVLAFASDYTMLEAALRRHGVAWTDPRLRVASLDHAMWFHGDSRADEWTLFAAGSPSATGGRGLGVGRMFSRNDGRLLATVAQEGMIRIKE